MDYKTLVEILDAYKTCVEFTERVSSCHSCSDCGKAETCEYVPQNGETNRFNCPLWKESINVKSGQNDEAGAANDEAGVQ